MNPVFMDGRFGTTDDTKVSVLDRGFLFGDGVYEVYRLYGKTPFARGLHLERLRRSLGGIELFLPYNDGEFSALLDELESMSVPDSYIYIHVTRGVAPRRHAFPDHFRPSVMAMAVPIGAIPEHLFRRGVGLISQVDDRWLHCTYKTTNLLANCMSMTRAARHGCFEALLVGQDGLVNESAASSFFAVSGGVLRTAPLSRNVLPGVTRAMVLELARNDGLPCEERAMTLEEVHAADEAFVTNSVYELLPVVRVDDRPVGGALPGEVTRRLMALFARRVADETGATASCAAGLVD